MEKTNLLIRHWKAFANRLEGKALKAKYLRDQAIKQADSIDEAAKTCLLNEFSQADEALSPNKEMMDEKLKRQTAATAVPNKNCESACHQL